MGPLQILLLIIILSALVVAHEWGHFIMARLFKIRVDDFSIGFGKRILRLGKLGDTEYNIRLLPLGGFVKIAGMDPDEEPINNAKDLVVNRGKAKDDPDASELPLIAENTAEGSAYDGPDAFNNKPLWQRSLVILGGPVMSFVTGWLILCILGCTFGLPIGKYINRVLVVQPGGEGHRIGLHAGDYITAINGTPVTDGTEMINTIHGSLGKKIVVTVRRGSQTITLPPATPKPAKDIAGKPVLELDVVNPGSLSTIGVQPGDQLQQVDDHDTTTLSALNESLTKDAGHKIKLAVTRGDTDKTLTGVVPANISATLPVVNTHEYGVLNFEPDRSIQRVSFVKSVEAGSNSIVNLFADIGYLIKAHQIQKSTGGVVAMANMTTIASKDGPVSVLSLAANISISLAIFNILPIPILDGGHLLAFFIEWLRRGKRMSPQMQQAFMLTGLAIIAVLFVLITGKDIWNQIRGNVPQ